MLVKENLTLKLLTDILKPKTNTVVKTKKSWFEDYFYKNSTNFVE